MNLFYNCIILFTTIQQIILIFILFSQIFRSRLFVYDFYYISYFKSYFAYLISSQFRNFIAAIVPILVRMTYDYISLICETDFRDRRIPVEIILITIIKYLVVDYYPFIYKFHLLSPYVKVLMYSFIVAVLLTSRVSMIKAIYYSRALNALCCKVLKIACFLFISSLQSQVLLSFTKMSNSKSYMHVIQGITIQESILDIFSGFEFSSQPISCSKMVSVLDWLNHWEMLFRLYLIDVLYITFGLLAQIYYKNVRQLITS